MKWSRHPEYDEIVASGYIAGLTAREIAGRLEETFGAVVTADQVSGRIRRIAAGLKDEPDPVDTTEVFRKAVDIEKERAEQRLLAREMTSAVKAQARWEELVDVFRDSITLSTPKAIPPLDIPAGSGTPEEMVVVVSDIHIGKLVDPDVVGENFGYSFPIFQARGEKLLDRILRLYGLHSNTSFIKKIRIYFAGDGVDGVDMRRGHPHRVDIQAATEQTLALYRFFDWLTQSLRLRLCVPVEVVWDFGNHGRVGEFGVNLPSDNWDYIAGAFLAEAVVLRGDTQVRVSVGTQKYHITELGPLRVYSAHGDGGTRGGGGFSGVPINGLAAALAADTGLHKQTFDLTIVGHWHNPNYINTKNGRLLVNGAWDGGDDYSVNQLKAASDPTQWAFGIHPTRGITWMQEIELAPKRLPTEVTK